MSGREPGGTYGDLEDLGNGSTAFLLHTPTTAIFAGGPTPLRFQRLLILPARVISAAGCEEMTSPAAGQDYALGWDTDPARDGHPAQIGHSGWLFTFNAHIEVVPDRVWGCGARQPGHRSGTSRRQGDRRRAGPTSADAPQAQVHRRRRLGAQRLRPTPA